MSKFLSMLDSCARYTIHGSATRLAIVSALSANGAMCFGDLKRLLALSDGNLSAHAHKLNEAGYLGITKRFVGRSTETTFTISNAGHSSLERLPGQPVGVGSTNPNASKERRNTKWQV